MKSTPSTKNNMPSIHFWSGDIFWVPRVEDAARALGYQVTVIQEPADVGAHGEFIQRRIPLTEPLDGPDAGLVRYLSEAQPALLIVDLNSTALPWARWIQVIKTSAATRRIPVLAFGPHVMEGDLKTARDAGADAAISRGKFQASLPELIKQWARHSPTEDLRVACRGEISRLASKGIDLHNRLEFFEAHEALEMAWLEASEHEGSLYRALLQITVAYLHLERGNLRGAAKMLLRVRQWLDPLPEVCRGVDIHDLRETVDRLRTTVDRASDSAELPPITELHRPFRISVDQL